MTRLGGHDHLGEHDNLESLGHTVPDMNHEPTRADLYTRERLEAPRKLAQIIAIDGRHLPFGFFGVTDRAVVGRGTSTA